MKKQIILIAILLISTFKSFSQFTSIVNTYNTAPRVMYADTIWHKLFLGSNFLDSANGKFVNGFCYFDLINQQIDTFEMARRFTFQVLSLKKIDSLLYFGGNMGYYDSIGNLKTNGFLIYDGNKVLYPPTLPPQSPPCPSQFVFGFEKDTNGIVISGNFVYGGDLNAEDIAVIPNNGSYLSHTNWPTPLQVGSGAGALIYYKDDLYAGGVFSTQSGIDDLVCYKNGSWQQVGSGLSGTNTGVNTFEIINGILYIGGNFVTAWGDPSDLIVGWDGTNFIPMGSLGFGRVLDIQEYLGEIYIVGGFTLATGQNVFAKWDGVDWVAVDGAVFTGGSTSLACDGPNLYIAGAFSALNGQPCGQVLRYTKTVGIDENKYELRTLKAYPNPSNSITTILCPNKWNNELVDVRMINAIGETVLLQQSTIEESKITIDVSNVIHSGFYKLLITSQKGQGQVSIVINK